MANNSAIQRLKFGNARDRQINQIACILLIIFFLFSTACLAQSYADSISQYRKQYAADLLSDKRAPIKPAQVKYLNFYPADPAYKVWATIKETPAARPFMVQTHSGKQKPFREYGTATFMLSGAAYVLHIYQSVDMMKDAVHKDELFIMFNDETNYESTYPGGRYIDLSIKDITGGKLLLDFNKCYNPYCAYANGYSCPIPPAENSLHVPVKAGEKMFLMNQ